MGKYSKILLFSIIAVTAKCELQAQKIIFQQDYVYKNKMTSSKLMGSQLIEDSITHERLLIFSGGKNITFYQITADWKMQKTFDVGLDKKSTFSNDDFRVQNFIHNGSLWNIIASSGGNFTAEVVDMNAGIHTVLGKIFEDKHPDFIGYLFSDEGKTYNVYFTKNKEISISNIDMVSGNKTSTLDFSSQLPLSKTKKYDHKFLFENLVFIRGGIKSILYYTSKKVHLYAENKAFILAIKSDEPSVELIYFDKLTGRKIKSELFSVEDLLAPGIKGDVMNTAMLLHEGRLWIYSGNRSGGVLAAFDPESKRLMFKKLFDEKMNAADFNYGPVKFVSAPTPGKVFGDEFYLKEKVEDISSEIYLKELSKRDLGISIHKNNAQEFIVSVGSYAEPAFLNASEVAVNSLYLKYPWIYNDSEVGIILSEKDLTVSRQTVSYNEVHKTDVRSQYTVVKRSSNLENAEYKEKRAFISGAQQIDGHHYVTYYYEKSIKIAEVFE